jgi:RNA polymerase sigma factor (sigma-70 family)
MENGDFFDFLPGIKYKKLSKKELNKSIKLAKEGNEKAFEEILSHMYNYLYHLSREFFIQGSDNDDIYQEAAIKLINVIEKYDKEKGSFVAFAQSSIRKHIITAINREMAQKRSILNESFSLDETLENEEGDKLSYIDGVQKKEDNLKKASLAEDPLDIVSKDYEEYLIEEISKNLSEMESSIFVLRFIEGYSYKEVAETLKLYKRNKKGKYIVDKEGEYVVDQKSVDNAICRSRPKIKKTLEKLNIIPKNIKEINDKLYENLDFKKNRKRENKNENNKIQNNSKKPRR